ncbi:hypothetical protein CRYUN_Cryun28dG0063900 [Craigia yunnanensis]
MACVGRGGRGDIGQRIRDEILMIQRNNDCKSGTMEEWHVKLHNNSGPDNVINCEALLNYLRSGFKLDVYWKTLYAHGLTNEKLASYDRPIVSEPCFRMDAKGGLIHDLTMYLKTLKIVKGLVETLMGAYPGCAMSFIAKKNKLSPIVTGYASKKIGLNCKPSIIFHSNGVDLEGYAGAGLYDSFVLN